MYVVTWDPRKSEATLAQRGVDFAQAARIFDGRTTERADARRDYGERRVIAVGMVDGVCLTVVYTDRWNGAVCERRIISARYSNRRERFEYGYSALHT